MPKAPAQPTATERLDLANVSHTTVHTLEHRALDKLRQTARTAQATSTTAQS